MQSSNIPAKIPLPFAYAAGPSYKNTIPTASQIGITNGKASLTDGFPPLTFQGISSGGVPPFGADFNGILNEITAIQQWQQAGGFFPYDSAFSTAVGGYPKGAIVESSLGTGFWVSNVENNTANPDVSGSTGWSALVFHGVQAFVISSTSVTLDNVNIAFPIIKFSGTLTGNTTVTIPNESGSWIIGNFTTGAYTLTIKTAAGVGVTLTQSQSTYIFGDGVNVYYADSSKVASFNGRVGTVTLNAGDVTAALGYTPGNVIYTGSYANTYQYTNQTATIPASQSGNVIILGGAGNSLTLPYLASCPIGAAFSFFGQGGTSTIYAQSGEHIGVGGATSLASITLSGTDNTTIVNDGGAWIVVNGTPMLPGAGGFACNAVQNGYQKLPSGIIMQWGLGYGVPAAPNTSTPSYVTVPFPITFPNGVFSIQVCPQDTFGGNDQMSTPLVYSNGNTSNFQYGNTDLDTGIGNFRFLAIGY